MSKNYKHPRQYRTEDEQKQVDAWLANPENKARMMSLKAVIWSIEPYEDRKFNLYRERAVAKERERQIRIGRLRVTK